MLTKEQNLLILLSRLTFSDNEKKEVNRCINDNINWFEFFKLCLYHKTATLCWYNIKQIAGNVFLPKYLDSMLEYFYLGIKETNENYLLEAKIIEKKLAAKDITVIPVKGVRMLQDIYIDLGIRFLGDIDYLVKYEDIAEVNKLMVENGYVQGYLDKVSNCIVPIDRAEEIKWKLYMSNLYPYRKKTLDDKICKVDFRYSLDDSLDKEPINEIVNYYRNFHTVRPEMLLLHLCTHFYDEAKHISTIKMAKDLNIIKLCDIREFILKYFKKINKEYFKKICLKYNLNAQAYFTLGCAYKLYSDQQINLLLSQIDYHFEDIMNSYGENLTKKEKKFRIDIWERFFTCNNGPEVK